MTIVIGYSWFQLLLGLMMLGSLIVLNLKDHWKRRGHSKTTKSWLVIITIWGFIIQGYLFLTFPTLFLGYPTFGALVGWMCLLYWQIGRKKPERPFTTFTVEPRQYDYLVVLH